MPSQRELEAEADRLLREDAAKQIDPETGKPYIKNIYGYGKYAKDYGILTPHDLVTIKKMEVPLKDHGFDESDG